MTKKILKSILIVVTMIMANVSCISDSAENPEFKEGEVYIYTNMPQAISAAVAEPMSFTMMVSPNDGSVFCRWLLDGVIISDVPDFEYTFYTPGEYELRFEAERDGVVNYRVFKLTVA